MISLWKVGNVVIHILVVLFNATECLQNESFIKPNFFYKCLHVFSFVVCTYKVKTGAEMKEANTVSVLDRH
jgi:type III secretory pathway component EscS